MFRKLISKIGFHGGNYMKNKIQFLQQTSSSLLPSRQKLIGMSVLTGGGTLVLVSAYKYTQNRDLYKVIDTNNELRVDKIPKSKRIGEEAIKREIELYMVNGIQNNEIERLKFIAKSKLNEDAPWDSHSVLNETIRANEIEILNFVVKIMETKGLPMEMNYPSKMYQCIIKSMYKTSTLPDEKLITSTLDSLSNYLKKLSGETKNHAIRDVFWQICKTSASEKQQLSVFGKIIIVLDRMIMDGCDIDEIDFRDLIRVNNAPMREELIKYLIAKKMDFTRETDDGRNLLFLIEEMIYRNSGHDSDNKLDDGGTEWKKLHNMITSSTTLKYPGVDSNGSAPHQRVGRMITRIG